jgi:hypothetical protein
MNTYLHAKEYMKLQAYILTATFILISISTTVLQHIQHSSSWYNGLFPQW